MITEIYVSIDGLEFTKLDLFKDESFLLNQNKKDLQNISKVFSPFSQSFSFPTTPKNKKALGFFGMTQAIKKNPDNKFKCKIYTNGVINQTGILTLESVKEKSFTGGFSTNLLSLADRIGSDTLNDLSIIDNSISYKPSDAVPLTQYVQTLNNIKHYVPLISNNRVWNIDAQNDAIDNISYKNGLDLNGNRVINFGELRPAVSLVSIFELIKAKYSLDVTIPITEKPEMSEAFMWCNNSVFNSGVKKFALTKTFDVEDLGGFATNNLTDSSTLLAIDNSINKITYRIQFKDVVFGDNSETNKVTISIVKKSTLETVLSSTFDFVSGAALNEADIVIPLFLFESYQFEYFTYIECEKPMFWKMNTVYMFFKPAFGSPLNNICIDSYNSDLTGLYKIDLIKSLPKVKVLDFLNSFFKTFNISIYDNSPTNENLFFLSPQDVNTQNKIYSKSVADYTRYPQSIDIEKKTNNPYNYYNFKHKTSKYKSNSDFKKQFNVEYGQVFFPNIKPIKANEFKVETEFCILPPVKVNGSDNLYTAYGFTSDSPTVSDDGKFRYTPNFDEMTIFYNHGQKTIEPIAIRKDTSYISLFTYLKSMPYCKQNSQTLAFSILKIDNVEFTNNLFLNYYQNFIQRLLNPNALSQQLSFILPPNEIYLNDANVTVNAGLIPKGFRMQNEVIVGETRYEILDSQIDLTTGKAKLTLLNF